MGQLCYFSSDSICNVTFQYFQRPLNCHRLKVIQRMFRNVFADENINVHFNYHIYSVLCPSIAVIMRGQTFWSTVL
jgi:hypothetical protein